MPVMMNMTYGSIYSDGKPLTPGGAPLYYISYTNGTSKITAYTVNIIKAHPHLMIKADGAEVSMTNSTAIIHVPILHNKSSYNVNSIIQSSLLGNNIVDFHYSVNIGGRQVVSGSMDGNGITKALNYSVPATQNLSITLDTNGNANYSADDPTAVFVPTPINNFVNITLTNSQTSATAAPFQQMLTVNSLLYQGYEAPNLDNIEFFYANGIIIPSWLEGNSVIQGASSSSTNTIYWLNIANGIPANSAINIYMGFASTSTNLFDGIATGEAPVLSSTYGQYDNGKSVFAYYYNGASDSSWTIAGSAGISTSAVSGSPFGTNAFYANSANGDYMYANPNYASSQNILIQYFSYTNGLGNLFFSASSGGAGTMTRIDGRGGSDWSGFALSRSWTSWNCPESGVDMSPDTWYTMTIIVDGSTGEIGDYYAPSSTQNTYPVNNYGTQLNALGTTYSDSCGGGTETYSYNGGYIGLVGDALGSSYITYWNGIMGRAYPPNGIMPSASFAAANQAAVTTFTENGLPASTTWNVIYGGILSSSSINSIKFNTNPGTFSYIIANQVVGVNTYVPSPASGNVIAGNTVLVTFAEAPPTCGISLSNTVISFGNINPGSASATGNLIVDTNSGGNVNANILVEGTNWISGSANFAYANTLWNPISAGARIGTPLMLYPGNFVDTNIAIPGGGANSIYFGTAVPPGEPAGPYTQNIVIENLC
jgi:hypothetical protein